MRLRRLPTALLIAACVWIAPAAARAGCPEAAACPETRPAETAAAAPAEAPARSGAPESLERFGVILERREVGVGTRLPVYDVESGASVRLLGGLHLEGSYRWIDSVRRGLRIDAVTDGPYFGLRLRF